MPSADPKAAGNQNILSIITSIHLFGNCRLDSYRFAKQHKPMNHPVIRRGKALSHGTQVVAEGLHVL